MKGIVCACVISAINVCLASLESGHLFPDSSVPTGPRHVRVPESFVPAVDELYYNEQRLNHFDGSDIRYWMQRYFVNKDYYKEGGPVFLVIGGNTEADPAWITNSAITEYASEHAAMLVMLEHRYYGLSRPVEDLKTENMKLLSSRQALSDLARFIEYVRPSLNVPSDTHVILFGGFYAGALAAWFRAQYPYLALGAVTSAAPMVPFYDYQAFYIAVGEAIDTTGPSCSENIRNATTRMYDWWGQPDKRELMQKIFRLCHKIDHTSLIDVTVFFYNLAHNFADVVLNAKLNHTLPGGVDVTIDKVCSIMSDDSRGDPIQRYADVNSLMLDAYKSSCLDIRYSSLVTFLKQTAWNSTSAKGSRQWLYQLCAEFGWAKSSWSSKQPFGLWFTFPWNYTMDKCDSAFNFLNVDENVQESNMYYGGLNIELTNAIFVNGDLDPWRTVGITTKLPKSPNADIILIPDVSHCADMYATSPDDPPGLTKARQNISSIIRQWLDDQHR